MNITSYSMLNTDSYMREPVENILHELKRLYGDEEISKDDVCRLLTAMEPGELLSESNGLESFWSFFRRHGVCKTDVIDIFCQKGAVFICSQIFIKVRPLTVWPKSLRQELVRLAKDDNAASLLVQFNLRDFLENDFFSHSFSSKTSLPFVNDSNHQDQEVCLAVLVLLSELEGVAFNTWLADVRHLFDADKLLKKGFSIRKIDEFMQLDQKGNILMAAAVLADSFDLDEISYLYNMNDAGEALYGAGVLVYEGVSREKVWGLSALNAQGKALYGAGLLMDNGFSESFFDNYYCDCALYSAGLLAAFGRTSQELKALDRFFSLFSDKNTNLEDKGLSCLGCHDRLQMVETLNGFSPRCEALFKVAKAIAEGRRKKDVEKLVSKYQKQPLARDKIKQHFTRFRRS